jgi:hypothetical protein
VKLGRSLREKFIPLLQEFVAPTEMEIKSLVWRSADQIKKPRKSRKGTASTSLSSLRSDVGGGNGVSYGSSYGGGGNNGGNGDSGPSGENRDAASGERPPKKKRLAGRRNAPYFDLTCLSC